MTASTVADPRDAEVAALDERTAAAEQRANRTIRAAEAKIETSNVAFAETWGTDDGDARRRNDRPGFDRACAALRAEQQPHKELIQAARGELEDLPRQRWAAFRGIAAQAVGPDIPIATIALPRGELDSEVLALEDKRDRAVTARDQQAADLATIEALLPADQAAVDALGPRFRLGLVASDEMRAPTDRLEKTLKALGKAREQVVTLTSTIADLDGKIAARQAAVESERQTEIARVLNDAERKMADAIYHAMIHSTFVKRLQGISRGPRESWTLGALDGDDGHSEGRELLAAMMRRGWQPPKTK
jgi:hypothetical protein